MKSTPSNLSNCTISQKNKMSKFGTKNALFGYFFTKNTLFEYFWARVFKHYCHIWNQHLRICLITKLVKKQKYLNSRPKMLYLHIFEQKCLIWVFLSKSFSKTIVILEISTFKFVYFQNFTEKQKCLNLGPKWDPSIFGPNLGPKLLDLDIFGQTF